MDPILPVSCRTTLNIFRNAELACWKVPKELSGLVLDTFEELKRLFPENEDFEEVHRKTQSATERRYVKFMREHKNVVSPPLISGVAYECNHCEKIITGPPEMKVEKPFDSFLGIHHYCTNCTSHIYSTSGRIEEN